MGVDQFVQMVLSQLRKEVRILYAKMAQLSHVLMEANPLLEGGTLDAPEANLLVVMDPLRQLLEGQDVMMEENLFALTM